MRLTVQSPYDVVNKNAICRVQKRKRLVYYFYMKKINGNTLIIVRRKSVKRLRSGKIKEHCHDFKIKTAGRRNK